jgi:hypothetical protein
LSALLLAPLLVGARVYHTEEEALALAFPEASSIQTVTYLLDDGARLRAAERCGNRIRDRLVTFYEARREEVMLGRAVILKERAKTLPFHFLVALRPDGAVDQVLLLDFREPRGYEIDRSSFRRQYRGKTLRDPVRRGRDIRNISGATISVDALSRGVRRALALAELANEPEFRPVHLRENVEP